MNLGRIKEGSLKEVKYLIKLADFYCDNVDWAGEVKYSDEFIHSLSEDEIGIRNNVYEVI